MNRFQRSLVLWSSVLTGGTGVVYWWMDTMLEPVSEWAVVNHPLQPWVLKAHIIVAPVLVFAVGMIAVEHIWKHFRSKVQRGRASGLTSMYLIVPMVVTGYLIQAVTHETWLTIVAWVHIGTGLVYSLGLLVHWWVIRRSKAQARERAQNLPHPGSVSDPEMRPSVMRKRNPSKKRRQPDGDREPAPAGD